MPTSKILVTGGTGCIGSHTVIQLLNYGFEVVILDNLSNSKLEVLNRIKTISNCDLKFIDGDIRDENLLDSTFSNENIESVIHFAGLKSVGESNQNPIKYYENNFLGTLTLVRAMLKHRIKKLVFSSSATVYGQSKEPKCKEDFQLNPNNPYGRTKQFIEELIRDLAYSDNDFRYGILRYFNPIGAHESGILGEDPTGIPNNLLPFISQVAIGRREILSIWGNDYPTVDGTGKRDYIHVEDLAAGHIFALRALNNGQDSFTVNLGTGKSYSVLEVLEEFQRASGKNIPYKFEPRRKGDVADIFADANLAKNLLGWSAHFDLAKMCEDAWRWQKLNPNGFDS